jgi:hypothetical protein
MIYCTKYMISGFYALTDAATSEVSYITNRLVHYIVKWQALVLGRQQQPESLVQTDVQVKAVGVEMVPSSLHCEGTNLAITDSKVAEDPKVVYEMLSAPKQYPIETLLGQLQHQVYAEGGLLELILGPKMHARGRGKIDGYSGTCRIELTMLRPNVVPVIGFTVEAPATGVWFSETMAGLLLRCEKGVDFWIPLHRGNNDQYPCIYASSCCGTHLRNLDLFGPQDIQVLGAHLLSNLEKLLKSLG